MFKTKLKKKQILITTLILFMLLTSIDLIKSAPTYNDITLLANNEHTHPQMSSAQMNNGKYVYVYIEDSAIEKVHVYVYGTDGSEDASISITVGNLPDEIEGFVISPIDSDDLLIIVVCNDLLNDDIWFEAIEFNTNSYVYNQYVSSDVTHANAITGSRTMSEIIWYSNIAYGFFMMETAGDQYYIRYSYDYSSNVVEVSTRELSSFIGWTFHFFDSEGIEGSEWVYLVSADDDSYTTAIYLKWDLLNWNTTNLEVLAVHPNADDWEEDNILSLRFISGDIFWSTSESDYIFYAWWTHTDTSYASVSVYCHRLRFNSTGIDSDNLEAQDRLRDGVNIPNVASGTEVSHIGGYEVEYNYTVIWHSYLYATPSTYRTAEIEFEVTQFDDFASSTIDIAGTRILDEDAFPNKDDDEFTFKDPTSQFLTTRNSTVTRIYYGLSAQAGVYDVTMTYSPSDDPPQTLTRYQFWGVAYSGAFPVVIDYEWYIDDSLVKAGETGGQGQFFDYFTFSVAGIHTMTVTLYDKEGVQVYTEDFNFLFETIDDDTSEDTIGITIGITMLVRYLPLLIVILGPAFMLYEIMKSVEGLLFGLGLGVAMAGMVGLLPIHYFFTLLVLVGVTIFYRSRSGSP